MCNLKRGLEETMDETDDIVDADSSDSAMSDSSDESFDSNASDEGSNESEHENEVATADSVDDPEDELIKAIKIAKEKVRDHPPDITTESTIVDICFHPVRDLLAVGTIEGDILVYSYSDEVNQIVDAHEVHTKACRAIEFNSDGTLLYSVSKDKSIMLTDLESGKLKYFYENAHEVPIYCLEVLNENTFVTGDDDGIVRMWDLRHKATTPIFSIKPSNDYISDMITNAAHKYLVCASGDGALSTINMNTRKIYVQTEEYDSEFTCLGLFKNESKILAGSSKGKMYLFNWGEFGLHSDEYPGPKQSISSMVPVTENIAVISGEDGILRAYHLFPHKHLGIVGQHSISVDKMDISNNGHYIASFSYSNDIRFWNIAYFEDVEVQTKKQNKKKDMKNNLPSSKIGNASDFFAGMS